MEIKNYALKTLTIEDAIFQSEDVGFIMEMADNTDKIESSKINLKLSKMLFELKWSLLEMIEGVRGRTPFLKAKDEAVEQEMNLLDDREAELNDEMEIERQMSDEEKERYCDERENEGQKWGMA